MREDSKNNIGFILLVLYFPIMIVSVCCVANNVSNKSYNDDHKKMSIIKIKEADGHEVFVLKRHIDRIVFND